MLLLSAVPAVSFAQSSSPIKRTNPDALSTPTGYSHVVEVAGPAKIVYVAGQVARAKDGKVVGERDMKAQAEQVFKNLEAALAAAGAKFSDVVKMTTYTTDMSQSQAIRDVRVRYFGDTVPASTMVGVPTLANAAYMLEIEVIAAVAAPKP
ncbi:MAG: RidA family protein [Acidobacteria bacterium]|nr:RidA family protein [Acidobacteriota bacterium]